MHPPYFSTMAGLLTSPTCGSHMMVARSLAPSLSAFLQTWLHQQGTLRALHLLSPRNQQQQVQQEQPSRRYHSNAHVLYHSSMPQLRLLQQFSNTPLQVQQHLRPQPPMQHFQQQQQQHYRTTADSPSPGRFDRFRPDQPQQQQRQQRWQQQQRHKDSSNAPDAALLTHQLMSAESPGELVKLFVNNVQNINHIHVIAALSRAAALWDQTALPAAAAGNSPSHGSNAQQPPAVDIQRQQLQQLLKHLAGPFARSMQYYKGREISTGLWAYARCRQPVPDDVITAVTDHVSSWDILTDSNTSTQHLVNLSWAVTTLGCNDRKLYSAIAAAALRKVQDLTASQVSVLAWTLARAGYRDNTLITALADRAKLLLIQQQQTYEQQQQQGVAGLRNASKVPKQKAGKKTRKSDEWLKFKPGGLTGLAWAFGSTWRWSDVELVSTVAAVSCQKPLVYDFKPLEAANLIKGLAIAAGMVDLESDHDDHNDVSSSSSSRGSDTEGSSAAAAACDLVDGIEELRLPDDQAAAAAAAVSADDFWPAACTVASAALRRQDDAQASSFARIMWALAELYRRRQQNKDTNPTAAAAAAAVAAAAPPVGSEVVEQLAAAVLKLWRRQQVKQQTLVITAWGLAKAQQYGLVAPLLLPASSSSSSPGPAVQQLFGELCSVVIKMADRDLFQPYQLADLAAAMTQLQYGIKLPPPAAANEQQQMHSSSSSTSAISATAQEPTLDDLSVMVDQQIAQWDAARAGNAANADENASKLSAAVAAVFAAAERVASGDDAGGMRLLDAAKLIAAVSRVKGHHHQDLLQQLVQLCQKNLIAADNETLLFLTKVLVKLARQQPRLLLGQSISSSSAQIKDHVGDDLVSDRLHDHTDHDQAADQDQGSHQEQTLDYDQASDQDLLESVFKLWVERWKVPEHVGGPTDSQRSRITNVMTHQLKEPFKSSRVAVQLRELCYKQ